jgi:hypothetical protein
MTRVLPVHLVLCVLFMIAAGAGPSRAQQTSAPPETLIRLSVSPAPAPTPALRYSLLPELKELSPGNPIEGYFKCYLEQYRFTFDEARFANRRMLLAEPLEELPGSDLREFGRLALSRVDQAARLDNPDWQILLKMRADGYNTLLPDVQSMRALARALQARFRAEVAGGQIDDAIRTAKTMFAMSRHLGEHHPCLIGYLVGAAIASIAFTPLDEMLEQPGCPNLYWALANLPDPFISIRLGIDGERMMGAAFFRELDSTAPMSAEQLRKFIDPLDRLIGDGKGGPIRDYLAARTKDAAKLAAARKRLVDSGLPDDRLKAFPPDQVILLDEAREFQVRFDEMAKITVFPTWQFETLLEKANAKKKEPAWFADALLQFFTSARRAQARLEQRFALLRHVEALRMYAAEHNSAFPAKLADLSVPLADDPFTGKPFLYEVSGKTAHLRGTPPAAEKNNPNLRIHYELSLRK